MVGGARYIRARQAPEALSPCAMPNAVSASQSSNNFFKKYR